MKMTKKFLMIIKMSLSKSKKGYKKRQRRQVIHKILQIQLKISLLPLHHKFSKRQAKVKYQLHNLTTTVLLLISQSQLRTQLPLRIQTLANKKKLLCRLKYHKRKIKQSRRAPLLSKLRKQMRGSGLIRIYCKKMKTQSINSGIESSNQKYRLSN